MWIRLNFMQLLSVILADIWITPNFMQLLSVMLEDICFLVLTLALVMFCNCAGSSGVQQAHSVVSWS